MRLVPGAFNGLLNGLGQDFGWRRGYACPCFNPQTGAAKTSCKTCGGKGRFWSEPVTGRAGVMSRQALNNFANFGVMDAGDIALTIGSDSPLYGIGQYDRVLMLNRTEPFSINVAVGINDSLKFDPVSVERAFYAQPSGDVIEFTAPTVVNGALVYAPGSVPRGATISLTGRRRPEYFVYIDMPVDRPHQGGADLPRRVVIRRFDLFGRA